MNLWNRDLNATHTKAATPLKEIVRTEKKLLLALDYGTKTGSGSYRVASDGEAPSLLNVKTIHWGADYQFPQQVAWGRDGNFYWGDVSRINLWKFDSIVD